MRDLRSKPKNFTNTASDSSAAGGSGSGEGENAKKKILSLVNDDFCGAILDTSFPRMLKREKLLPETARSLGVLELWSDDFEGKGEFSQYRSRLVCFTCICDVNRLLSWLTKRMNYLKAVAHFLIVCVWVE